MILTVGGIPLIYLGDEIGTLNDYSYRHDPAKAGDSRWVHRPFTDWDKIAKRQDPESIEGRVYQGLCRLIALRVQAMGFGGSEINVMDTGNEHVLGYVRQPASQKVGATGRILVFANFSEHQQIVPANQLRLYGLGYHFTNALSGESIPLQDLSLEPYGFVCLIG